MNLENVMNKSYMIKLSLDKTERKKIEDQTSWMDGFYTKLPLKIRCLALALGYTKDTFPKCANCGAPTGYDKALQQSFNKCCSDKCAKEYGRLSEQVRSLLLNKEWLYDQRINQKKSFELIGKDLGISEVPVRKYCKLHEIEKVRYNENTSANSFLDNIQWLYNSYIIERKTCEEIGNLLGCSKAHVSMKLSEYKIETRDSNEYERKIKRRSNQEIQLAEFIESLGVEIITSDRTTLKGKEIDILIPHLNIGFEYNGIYTHSSLFKDKTYHISKTNMALENGVRLFHIFEDDWVLRNEITKSIIKSRLGVLPNTVYARKCLVETVSNSELAAFFRANHLQGADKSSLNYALKHEGVVVAAMSFCPSRYNKSAKWELSRYAVKIDYSVVGGFSKLLKHFKNNNVGSIISYANKSISFGDVYATNGFELIKDNPPSYWYVDIKKGIDRKHRSNYAKHKLINFDCYDENKTEEQIMKESGFLRIWDCGTLTYFMK